MGGNYRERTKEEIEEHNKFIAEQKRLRLEDTKRFAMKLATIAIDNIITDIVRPGPKPEERECYDVANEIRQHQEFIINEMVKAIQVEATSGKVVKFEYRGEDVH